MASRSLRSWFVVPAIVLLLGFMTLWSMRSRMAPPRTYEGDQTVLITVRAPNGGGQEAARAVLHRLVIVGVDAELAEADDAKFVLRARRVAEPAEAMRAVLRPQALEFAVISTEQSVPEVDADTATALPFIPTDGGALLNVVGGRVVEVAQVPPTEQVKPWLTGTSRGEVLGKVTRLPADRAAELECVPSPDKSTPALCAAWLVEQRAPFDGRSVTSATLSAHRRTEEPLVTLVFKEDAARALEELTSRNVGRMIAVTALGELQARPLVEATVQGGSWTFSTRTGDTDRRAAVERAERIQSAAALPPLPTLELVSVEPLKLEPPK